MNPGYDLLRVAEFLAFTAGLRGFCPYFRRKIEKEVGEKRPDLKMSELAGDRSLEKAEDLVDIMERRGNLTSLVFHLAGFWFSRKNPKAGQVFFQEGLYNDLCLAVQEIWREDTKAERAVQGMDWLAMAHDGLNHEWVTKEGRTALDIAPHLGPIGSSNMSLDQVVAHLAGCRELYTQALEELMTGQLETAQEKFDELEGQQPNYQPGGRDILAEVYQQLEHCQKLYDQADECRQARRWLEARDKYLELVTLEFCGDLPSWMQGLAKEEEVARLQKMIDALGQGLVYDRRLPWGTDHPYLIFQEMGSEITPRSSMARVQEELRRLKDIPEEKRARLESLAKGEVERFFVDAFLYPVHPSPEIITTLEESLIEEKRLPSMEELAHKHPIEVADLFFLQGESELAADKWRAAQQALPRDGRLAHCQALFFLTQACAEIDEHLEKGVESWEQAISHWAVSLADMGYWIRWGRDRCKQYDRPFVFQSIANLRTRIQAHLQQLILAGQEQLAQTELTDLTKAMGRLLHVLAIEFEATRLAQALGGIAFDEAQLSWFGPLWMVQYGWYQAVAQHLATMNVDNLTSNQLLGKLSPREALRRLRWYFSYLKTAAILLEGPTSRPQEVLQALTPAACKQTAPCNQPGCPVHSTSPFPVAVCCPHEGNLRFRIRPMPAWNRPRSWTRCVTMPCTWPPRPGYTYCRPRSGIAKPWIQAPSSASGVDLSSWPGTALIRPQSKENSGILCGKRRSYRRWTRPT